MGKTKKRGGKKEQKNKGEILGEEWKKAPKTHSGDYIEKWDFCGLFFVSFLIFGRTSEDTPEHHRRG